MSIKKMFEMSLYNENTQEWEDGVPTTIAAAVTTADGSDVQVKLDAVPGQINSAVAGVVGGAGENGNTLGKLHGLVTGLQTLVESDDTSLDTIKEITAYIKENREDLTLMGIGKVDTTNIVNDMETLSTVEGKVLDARVGQALKGLIDTMSGKLETLQGQTATFATQEQVAVATVASKPTISSASPSNPVNGQIWYKPVGTVEA